MSNAYDEHHYPTKAQPQLHPDNLYTTAFLRGYSPVPVETAKVLEIGCGNGLNLLPMAAEMPQAEFVGIDYAEMPIQIAKSLSQRFGLTNVRFHQADICDLADDFGEFDYVIVHGFYSWVPDQARDALWRVARGSLSPQGMMQVSYNALPGWYQTKWLREFCLFHVRSVENRDSQIQEAWKLIEELASMKDADNPFATVAAQTVEKGLATAIHDELAELNTPFYLHQVAERANEFSLRYVADAVPKFMAGLQHLPPGEKILVEYGGSDPVQSEQYEDFLSQRTFRQSVFTHQAHTPAAESFRDRLRHCWVNSTLRVGVPDEEGNRIYDSPRAMMGFHSTNPMLAALFEEVAAHDPGVVLLGEFSVRALAENPSWAGAILEEFWELAEDLARHGVLQTYSRDIPVSECLGERPRMAGITKWEALLGLPLTGLFHRSENFPDPLHRALAAVSDGTRTIPEICAHLAELMYTQWSTQSPGVNLLGMPLDLLSSQVFRQQPQLVGKREDLERFLVATVPVELERFRSAALLHK